MGTSGNLIAYGGRDDGILQAAIGIHECGSGMRTLERHRVTGREIRGFELPWWSEAIDLAKRSQRCLPTLRALGWDIALAEHGPRVIEANANWDPPLYAPQLMSNDDWQRLFGRGRSAPS